MRGPYEDRPTHVIVGPAEHGVVDHAVGLLAAGPLQAHPRVVAQTVAQALHHVRALQSGRLHLHITDHLWGANPAEAWTAVQDCTRGRAWSVTLHDVPQASDGPHLPARARFYRAVAERATEVIVSSDHERQLLRDIGVRKHIRVVPLPLAAPSRSETGPLTNAEVAMVGFMYPGKGHVEVAAAMRELPSSAELINLGGISTGHEWLVDEVRARSFHPFSVTGYLSETEFIARMQRARVPVCAHTHISASGTIGRWLSAGRRPIVMTNPYAREVNSRNPGALWLVDDLREAITAAWADPMLTVATADLQLSPSTDEVAAALNDVLRNAALAS